MQITPPPQARTAEEYDAYLDVAEAASPPAVLEAAKRFQHQHPDSPLRSLVLERCFSAHRMLGERGRAVESGEASLEANPHNLSLRAQLAAVIANGAASEQEVSRAESHARRALDELSRFHPPRTILLAEWRRIEAKIRSAAHSALGLAAFRRDQTAEAIRELEQALQFAPDPALFYRLGRLYRITGREAEAVAMFRKALEGDEPAIRALAQKELGR